MTTVEVNNVYLKSRREEAVFANLNLSLSAQSATLILGGPGSGKTTLTALLIGNRFPDSGSIEVLGAAIERRRVGVIQLLRRQIGLVGEVSPLITSLTVAENIKIPHEILGSKKRLIRERTDELLFDLGLTAVADSYPRALTRAEYGSAQLARALSSRQKVLIFDEPAARFDAAAMTKISKSVQKAKSEYCTILVLSSVKWDFLDYNQVKTLVSGSLQ